MAWTFSLAICCLGLAAAWGGLQLPRVGPRRLAMAGGVLFGGGYLVAALALHWKSLPLLYLGYGVMGGIGLGLGYVTPVATVAKWFPDKKGLTTGMVIMGFGFGALLMSKLFAPLLYRASGGNLVAVFAWLGVGFMVASSAWRRCCQSAAGFCRAQGRRARRRGSRRRRAPRRPAQAFPPGSSQPATSPLMWLVFFANILAGISLIASNRRCFKISGTAATRACRKKLAAYGATLIAVSSLFNGVGRMFWGGLSDRIGRMPHVPHHAGQPDRRLSSC